jgi:molybdenum-dependent DNA-binding transcriptional regulator ModE
LLDLIEARGGSVGDAARLLGVSTTSAVSFLEREHSLWEAANAIRRRAGKEPLSRRK